MASWNRDWQCVTDMEEKKQGSVVYLSLPDKIRESCNDISVTDLNKTLYAKNIIALAYMAYDRFENEMAIVDYINEFEHLYNKIGQFDMV